MLLGSEACPVAAFSVAHPSSSVLPQLLRLLRPSGSPCRPRPGRTSLFVFSLRFSQFKMAALSSAETPPPVFNGDAAEREPGRERGLEEPGSGFNAACTTRIPGGAQNEEVSAATLWLAALTRGKGLRAPSGGPEWKCPGSTGCDSGRV